MGHAKIFRVARAGHAPRVRGAIIHVVQKNRFYESLASGVYDADRIRIYPSSFELGSWNRVPGENMRGKNKPSVRRNDNAVQSRASIRQDNVDFEGHGLGVYDRNIAGNRIGAGRAVWEHVAYVEPASVRCDIGGDRLTQGGNLRELPIVFGAYNQDIVIETIAYI